MLKTFKILSIVIGISFGIFLVLLVSGKPEDKSKDKDIIKEKSAIDSQYIKFEGYIREGDFASAYRLMSPSYKSHKNLESFTRSFQFLQKKEEYRLHPQRFLKLDGNTALLFPHDTSSSAWWLGLGFGFQKVEGRWYLTGEIVTYQD